MTADFNYEQKKLLNKIGVRTDFNSDMSDDEAADFIDKVSEYLQLHGLTDDGVNEVGKLCESILDIIADI